MAFVRKDAYRNRYWSCSCDCGNTKIISVQNLLSGSTQSCRECRLHADYSGRVFGRLTSTGLLGRLSTGERALECSCICKSGARFFSLSRLLDGQTKSCGCLKREYETKKPGTFLRSMVCRYKVSASVRKLDWKLDTERAIQLLGSPCIYSGDAPSHGIDRVDNTKGYIEGNVVPCCKQCNRAKLNMTLEAFTSWLDNLCLYRSTNAKVGTARTR